MGMAASQARYLALVARKSNCEYEGQQINQARLNLSNQSANLFNQMLGLNVPVPPSTQDFTKRQYSFSDGVNDAVIDKWEQLARPESDYNYIVTYHYNKDVYTGAQKKLNDPQVQFSQGKEASIDEISTALRLVTEKQKAWTEAQEALTKAKADAATLSRYVDKSNVTNVNDSSYSAENDVYQVKGLKGEPPTTEYTLNYTGYAKLTDDQKTAVKDAIQKLVDVGALKKDVSKDSDLADVYYCPDNDDGPTIAFSSDLRALQGGSAGGQQTILPVYHLTGASSIDALTTAALKEITEAQDAVTIAKGEYDTALADYESYSRPVYIGNCPLTLLTELTAEEDAELQQVLKDMKKQGLTDSIMSCFNDEGVYVGGVYKFTMNGITYYTTYEDLDNSYASGTGINNIDDQVKLSYYNASYVSTKIEKTSKALLETDSEGRFTTVRFEDDTVKYSLNVETITDDAAYQDAMNKFYYENAVYDKMVQDINAKTSIIQQEDRTLEIRLKQLETEQRALSTEMEAVQKVVHDNVDKSFKTFSG